MHFWFSRIIKWFKWLQKENWRSGKHNFLIKIKRIEINWNWKPIVGASIGKWRSIKSNKQEFFRPRILEKRNSKITIRAKVFLFSTHELIIRSLEQRKIIPFYFLTHANALNPNKYGNFDFINWFSNSLCWGWAIKLAGGFQRIRNS
jgi:hypothetical protein